MTEFTREEMLRRLSGEAPATSTEPAEETQEQAPAPSSSAPANAARDSRLRRMMLQRLEYEGTGRPEGVRPPITQPNPLSSPMRTTSMAAAEEAEQTEYGSFEFLNQQTDAALANLPDTSQVGPPTLGQFYTQSGGRGAADDARVVDSLDAPMGVDDAPRDRFAERPGVDWLDTALNSFAIGQAPVAMGLMGATSERALNAAGAGDLAQAVMGNDQGMSVLNGPREEKSWSELYSDYYQTARGRFNEAREETYDRSFAAGASADVAGAAPGLALSALKTGAGVAGWTAKRISPSVFDNAIINRLGARVNSRLAQSIQSVSRVAPAEAIDRALGRLAAGIGGVQGLLARLGVSVGAAGVAAGAEQGTSTDWDLDQVTGAVGEAALWALPMQLALGEGASRAIRWATSDRAAIQMATELVDRVQTPDAPGSYTNVRQAIDDLKPGDTVLGMKIPNSEGELYTSRKMLDFIEKYAPDLPGTNLQGRNRLGSKEYGQMWQQTESSIIGAAAALKQKVGRTWRRATEAPSLRQVMDTEKAQRQGVGDIIGQIRSDRIPAAGQPAPLGATTITANRAAHRLSNGALTFDNLSSINSLTKGQKRAYLKAMEAVGLGEKAKRQLGMRVKKPAKGSIPKEVTVSNLYRARTELAGMVGSQDTRTIPGEQRAFVTHMIKEIDDMIADELGNVSADARAAYSQSMRRQRSYLDGQQLFAGRTFDLTQQSTKDLRNDIYGANVEEYLETIKDDPARVKSFRDGFANALNQHIGEHGFPQTMERLVGPPDPTGQWSGGRAKEGNIQLLRRILGDKTANGLLTAYAQDAAADNFAKAHAIMEEARSDVIRTDRSVSGDKLPGQEAASVVARKVNAALRRAIGTDTDYGRQVLRLYTEPVEVVKQRLHHGLDMLEAAAPVVGTRAAATEGYERDEANPEWLDEVIRQEEALAEYLRQRIPAAGQGLPFSQER